LRKDLTSVSRSDIVVFVRDNNNYYRQGQDMTRKDYQLIAKVLADAPDAGGVDGLLNWGATCRYMARELANDNPRFNTVTFLDA